MPGTFLNFPFDEEIFNHDWTNAPDPVSDAMFNSGILVQDSTIASMIQNDGNLYTLPSPATVSTGTLSSIMAV